MSTKFSCFLAASAALSTVAFAQESAFSDYHQPMRGFVGVKNNFETAINQGVQIGTDIDSPQLEVGNNGHIVNLGRVDLEFFWLSGFKVPAGGMSGYVDIDFDVQAQAGLQSDMRIYVGDGNGGADAPNGSNGGLARIPDAATAGYVHMKLHRKLNRAFGADTYIYLDVDFSSNHYVGGGGSNFNARLRIDNLRVSVPRTLAGLYTVTGTTDKNLGSATFSSDGTTLGTYTDWIQNLGNVNFVDVMGRTNFGYDSNATNSSNLLFSWPSTSGYNDYAIERLATAFDTVGNEAWIGSGPDNGGTDRFYGVQADDSNIGQQYLFRQNLSNGVFTHSIRCLSNSFYYGAEIPVDLGGEELVAVADINGDGQDDYVTRSGSNFQARLFVNNTGSDPNRSIVLSAPFTLNAWSNLKCLAVDDINGDGYDDLLMEDNNTGDIFAMYCFPNSSTLVWLFRLNDVNAANEKVLALADADADGLPEVYTTRQRVSDSVWEIDIRKLSFTSATDTQVLVLDEVAEYDQSFYTPCAVGDVNGDGSADIAMIGNDSPNYALATFLVNPSTRFLLGSPHWICNLGSSNVRPLFK